MVQNEGLDLMVEIFHYTLMNRDKCTKAQYSASEFGYRGSAFSHTLLMSGFTM
ncbi:hypothetical protein ES288_D11G052800v1 [Gossypium darwinii]|uniref:Uncharacterized protein n=2 Tax=Gossypium TaxID=3633 RepID=A0A5D2II46_GOSTO|nr:hypothetical protein ES288_D11G052800v1 [Gossypium darwinii]TYH42267.1 hypothetical protein ES332_D11G052600v1 [Gossypium tomentosum]